MFGHLRQLSERNVIQRKVNRKTGWGRPRRCYLNQNVTNTSILKYNIEFNIDASINFEHC